MSESRAKPEKNKFKFEFIVNFYVQKMVEVEREKGSRVLRTIEWLDYE